MDIFEIALEKKKKYISIQNLEASEDIKQFVLELTDLQKNIDDKFANRELARFWKDLFIGKNPNATISIVDSSIFQNGCRHRIDLSIDFEKDNNYRIFVSSCDAKLVVEDISAIPKEQQKIFKKEPGALKLFVSMYDLNNKLIGNLEITSTSYYELKLSGTLNSLQKYANQKLGMHVHEKGDVTNQCKNCGKHYNPFLTFHGGLSGERHLGDFGNIQVNKNGISNVNNIVTFQKDLSGFNNFNVMGSFAGRSLVLHNGMDDLGMGNNYESGVNGNSGERIACGVIGAIFV